MTYVKKVTGRDGQLTRFIEEDLKNRFKFHRFRGRRALCERIEKDLRRLVFEVLRDGLKARMKRKKEAQKLETKERQLARRRPVTKDPLEEAEISYKSGRYLSSILMATVALELALRDELRKRGIEVEPKQLGPLLKSAISAKLIDEREIEEIREVLYTRNAAVHEGKIPDQKAVEGALEKIRHALTGASGNILIKTSSAPSPLVTVNLGGTLNLYLGDVTWSGEQVDLYLSKDGYASLTIPGDVRYGPTFSVADIKSRTLKQITEGDLHYTVGQDWINGSVPTALEIPGGNYYVKAFDGGTASVAVTDNYFKIRASLVVTPSFGPGQASMTINGYALPANDYANLSYRCVSQGIGWTTIQDLVPADDLGRFTYSMLAPDLMAELPAGEQPEDWDTIEFRMIADSTGQTVTDTFDEYRRGLKQVKGVDRDTDQTSTDGYLFGNGTNFYSGTYQVDVTVLGDLVIAGYWFHPGSLTILWDGATTVGTVTANSTHGWFNTTVQIPITKKGRHNVTIDDGKTIFRFLVNVIRTLIYRQ